MNWTGGRLQRHSKTSKNETLQRQKQHLTKARQRLQDEVRQSSMPFQPAWAAGALHDAGLGFAPLRHAHTVPARRGNVQQKKLDDYASTAPVAHRLAVMSRKTISRKSTPRSSASRVVQGDARSERRLKPTAVPIKGKAKRPRSISRSMSRNSDCSAPISSPNSATEKSETRSVEENRKRLLLQEDWVGLSYTRPLKMRFMSHTDKQRIGKRRRVHRDGQHKHIRANYAMQEHSAPLLTEHLGHEHEHYYMRGALQPLRDDVSIRIGEEVLPSQGRVLNTKDSSPSQRTSLPSELMLLDEELERPALTAEITGCRLPDARDASDHSEHSLMDDRMEDIEVELQDDAVFADMYPGNNGNEHIISEFGDEDVDHEFAAYSDGMITMSKERTRLPRDSHINRFDIRKPDVRANAPAVPMDQDEFEQQDGFQSRNDVIGSPRRATLRYPDSLKDTSRHGTPTQSSSNASVGIMHEVRPMDSTIGEQENAVVQSNSTSDEQLCAHAKVQTAIGTSCETRERTTESDPNTVWQRFIFGDDTSSRSPSPYSIDNADNSVSRKAPASSLFVHGTSLGSSGPSVRLSSGNQLLQSTGHQPGRSKRRTAYRDTSIPLDRFTALDAQQAVRYAPDPSDWNPPDTTGGHTVTASISLTAASVLNNAAVSSSNSDLEDSDPDEQVASKQSPAPTNRNVLLGSNVQRFIPADARWKDSALTAVRSTRQPQIRENIADEESHASASSPRHAIAARTRPGPKRIGNAGGARKGRFAARATKE